MNFCAPQNFVSHPVTNPGKAILHQQDGFNRSLLVSAEKVIDKFLIETAFVYFRNIGIPPIRVALAVMKSDAPKLPRIAKDKCSRSLVPE